MIYEYKGFGNVKSICDVKINKDKKIIIITELNNNSGTSITNAMNIILDNLIIDYNLNLTKYKIYEKYENDDMYSAVKFDMVDGKTSNIRWEFSGNFKLKESENKNEQ